MRGTNERRDRLRLIRGIGQDQVLDRDEARRCCRASRGRRGRANTAARARATRSSPIVAFASIATMSGRGVITSRTIVSRKSTSDRSSSRACPSWISACVGSGAALVDRRFGFCRRSAPAAAPGAGRQSAAARPVSGFSTRATTSKDGSSSVEHPLGIAPDDRQRDDVLADEHEDQCRHDEQRQSACGVDARHAREQTRGDNGDHGQHQPRWNEEPERLVEIAAKRRRPGRFARPKCGATAA